MKFSELHLNGDVLEALDAMRFEAVSYTHLHGE